MGLLLSRARAGLFLIPQLVQRMKRALAAFPSMQPQLSLENLLNEEEPMPLPSPCCWLQMHHFRKEAALLPTAWSARSEGEL